MAVDSRVVDKNIAELRRKLEPNPSVPQYILTVRGVGYKFRCLLPQGSCCSPHGIREGG